MHCLPRSWKWNLTDSCKKCMGVRLGNWMAICYISWNKKWNTYNHSVETENELSSSSLYPLDSVIFKLQWKKKGEDISQSICCALNLDLNRNVLPNVSPSGLGLSKKVSVTPTHQIRIVYLFVSNVYQFELSSILQECFWWKPCRFPDSCIWF